MADPIYYPPGLLGGGEADNFGRPDWWEKSRLFQEMITQGRSPEEGGWDGIGNSIPLGRSMYAGPLSHSEASKRYYEYAMTGERPWMSPLIFDRHMLKPTEGTEGYTYADPGENPMPLIDLGKSLHQLPLLGMRVPQFKGRIGPRTKLLHHIYDTQPAPYHDPVSKALFIEKHGPGAWENIRDTPTGKNIGKIGGGKNLGFARKGKVYVSPEPDSQTPLSRGVVAMHEQEHAESQRKLKFAPHMATPYLDDLTRAVREIPPSIGDIVNSVAAYRARHGEPVDYQIEFPGATFDADWMAQQAHRFGYHQPGGPSMSELIYGTGPGRAWLNIAAGGDEYKNKRRR